MHIISIIIDFFFSQTLLLKLSVFLEESSHRSSEDLLQLQEVDDSVKILQRSMIQFIYSQSIFYQNLQDFI